MSVKDFASAYPVTFCTGTVVYLALGYYDVKGIGEIMDKYSALQQVKKDSKHLDKVLKDMSAPHGIYEHGDKKGDF
jgi:hypothetical protein